MAGEWGRVSHKCRCAHGGGTCLEALLQVTPACMGGWTRQPPEAPSSLGCAGGRERWLLPQVPEQGQGQPGAGRGVGACPTAWAQWGRAAGARHARQLCHAGSKHAAMSCQLKPLGGSPCGKAFAGVRDQCGGGGSAGSALPWSPGARVPCCSHIPFPVPPSRLLHWPSARLESPCLCACRAGKGPAGKGRPSCLFLPFSSSGPIDRAVSAPHWAPPFPALLTQCSGSRGGFRGRGRGARGWEKLRGGR